MVSYNELGSLSERFKKYSMLSSIFESCKIVEECVCFENLYNFALFESF